ncbi:LVIVD repeat-containing protein [Parasporobacterium paucivorans]|uniref:Uncharacterized conserved protein n=1 Tax=Parasporobacterium paucivorans DSM 15970 TaxID=1122934 RepID=A0A1M6JHP2_9FIRM|nr:hypothetical protein [Parasporobacterium paucivorans]SHJ46183.1 Uncharacterized conserved protein [Parasporobacterium paucivorans DSM 15970]
MISKSEGYIKNMELVGYHDLDGIMAFQTQIYKTAEGRYYLYCGSMKGIGFNIVDITDPANPQSIRYINCLDPQEYTYSSTPKLQICDDLMIIAVGNGLPMLHGPYPEGGFKPLGPLMIYSLKDDPENPRLLSSWEPGNSPGVHRFCFNGGRYVHLSCSCPGYEGYIYRILDIIDPASPVEVGRWWMDSQFQNSKTEEERAACSTHFGGVHCVYVLDDKAYISCMEKGFYVVDVSDVTQPKTLGHLEQHPPFSGKCAGARCHTFLPVIGTDFAVGTHEGERFFCQSDEMLSSGAQPLNTIVTIDVSNPADPTMVATFPYPEVPADFPFKNFNFCGLKRQGPFGPHNLHEPMTNKPWIENRIDRVYNCYFHAGMRVYDFSDPYNVKEIAYFIPPNPRKLYYEVEAPGPLLGSAEDCVVDDRGFIFMNTTHDGLYILRCLV